MKRIGYRCLFTLLVAPVIAFAIEATTLKNIKIMQKNNNVVVLPKAKADALITELKKKSEIKKAEFKQPKNIVATKDVATPKPITLEQTKIIEKPKEETLLEFLEKNKNSQPNLAINKEIVRKLKKENKTLIEEDAVLNMEKDTEIKELLQVVKELYAK